MRIKAASMSACGLSRHFVFEADTGLVSADHNGSFDNHGFSSVCPDRLSGQDDSVFRGQVNTPCERGALLGFLRPIPKYTDV